jgi:prepilin-type N-terminal cleavage/methylation domain-containing protein
MLGRRRGFTLVEIIIVIVVIGILTTIVALGMSLYLAEGRDAQRASGTSAISEALEGYYDKNGEYPSCAALTANGQSVSQLLNGLDAEVLVAPKATGSTTNSLSCSVLDTSTNDFYEYKGDGSTTCTTGGGCLSYTLRYREERTGDIVEINSRRNASISTSGKPALTASGTGLTQVSSNWNAVPNALNYTLQVATNSSFSTIVSTKTITGYADTNNSLAYNTTYYLRVKANGGASTGDWSNTVTATTKSLSAPTISITGGATSVAVTWSAVTSASSYTVQIATNSGFSAGVQNFSVTGTTRTINSLAAGTTYYAHVRAVWNGNNGPWSSTASASTAPSAPTGVSISAAMSGNSAVGTASASCAQGSVQYQLRTRNTNTSTAGSWSSWSSWSTSPTRTVSSTAQGYQYGFQTQARCLSGSTASSTTTLGTVATTVREFNAPGAPSVSASTSGNTTTFTRSNVTCSGNGTAQYRYRRSTEANYGSYSSATTAGSATTTTTNQGYQYGMNWSARCKNTYSTSEYGSEGRATYTRPVDGPGPQSYNGYRQAWNIMYLWVYSSCGPGATLYGVVDVYTHDWSWSPGGYYGWRHLTPLGPTWPDGYKPNDALTGSQSSSGIPSGSRWNVGSSYRCQNGSTGRNSGGNIWRQSGIYVAS